MYISKWVSMWLNQYVKCKYVTTSVKYVQDLRKEKRKPYVFSVRRSRAGHSSPPLQDSCKKHKFSPLKRPPSSSTCYSQPAGQSQKRRSRSRTRYTVHAIIDFLIRFMYRRSNDRDLPALYRERHAERRYSMTTNNNSNSTSTKVVRSPDKAPQRNRRSEPSRYTVVLYWWYIFQKFIQCFKFSKRHSRSRHGGRKSCNNQTGSRSPSSSSYSSGDNDEDSRRHE